MSEENVEIVRGARYPVSLPNERAGQRRTLDERLFVRFPALYRLVADRLTRLRPGSRLRRLMVARRARGAAAAINRRDFDVLLLAIDPAIEYHPPADQLPPDLEEVLYGHDGYLKGWRRWLDAFEDLHSEPEEVLDLGDQLLGTTLYKGHGTGSGVPVNVPLYQLVRLRRGLVVWQKDFSDRSEALEAAAGRE